MRSRLVFLFLFILACSGGGLAFVHLTQNNLETIFGKSALPDNAPLFQIEQQLVQRISITSRGRARHYEERQGQWVLLEGKNFDRADRVAMETLVAFAAEAQIVASFPANRENIEKMGLNGPKAKIRMSTPKGRLVADFKIGKKSVWNRQIPPPEPSAKAINLPSIYLQPEGSKFIYLCSARFLPDVLENGFGIQRDLRPFFFPPELLAEITVERPNGKLVVARPDLLENWRITKPYQLDADDDAIKELIGGIFNLTAQKTERNPVTVEDDSPPELTLSLRFFDLRGNINETPVTLTLRQPQADDHSVFLGRLNDWRGEMEFTLPRSSENNLVGLDELPLTLQRLRSNTLATVNLERLSAITISGISLDSPLKVELNKSSISGVWNLEYTYQGKTNASNELTFYQLKKTLNEARTIEPVGEIAPEDLGRYGLKNPLLSLTLETFEGQKENLTFGDTVGKDGIPRHYLRRSGSDFVFEIDSSDYYQLSTRPHQWQDEIVWNFNILDLNLLQVVPQKSQDSILLTYRDLSQSWTARQGGELVTGLLNTNRANRLLENLSELRCDLWLEKGHPAANQALNTPDLTYQAVFKRIDDPSFEPVTKTLSFAKAPGGKFYYGYSSEFDSPFILASELYEKISEPILEE